MNDTFWMFIIGQIVTAAGVYAAIRSDLREHRVRIERAEDDIKELRMQ